MRSDISPVRVVIKAVIFFFVLNLLYAWLHPPVGKLSLYGWLLPPRERFPYGRTQLWYNLSLSDLNADFASHSVSNTWQAGAQYRVFILGDSQTWGNHHPPSETLSGYLNAARLEVCGRRAVFYNLSYPSPSVVKDFLILHKATEYKPDLVIWMLTLDSFRNPVRRLPMFLDEGQTEAAVLRQYGLGRYAKSVDRHKNIWKSTLVAERKRFSELARLQLNGFLWGATGIDAPTTPLPPRAVDLPAGLKWDNFQPPDLPLSRMGFDVLDSVPRMLGGIPVLAVNEPIFMPPGKNSDVRYDSIYPHWAYDQYRALLKARVAKQGWKYLDLYDAVPYVEFTNTDLHMSQRGEQLLAHRLATQIPGVACP